MANVAVLPPQSAKCRNPEGLLFFADGVPGPSSLSRPAARRAGCAPRQVDREND